MSIEEKEQRIEEIKQLIKEKIELATSFLDEGDYDGSDSVINEVNELREELKELQEELKAGEVEEEEEVREEEEVSRSAEGGKEETKTKTETKVETEVEKVEEEVKEKEEAVKVENKKEEEDDSEKEKGSDGKMAVEREVLGVNDSEKRSASDIYFEEHVMKRSENVEGITSGDDGFNVPEQVIKDIVEARDKSESLARFPRVKYVEGYTGMMPVLDKRGSLKLHETPELGESKQIAIGGFREIKYDLVQYTGHIEASNRALADAESIKQEIQEALPEAAINTENEEILSAIVKDEKIKTVNIGKVEDFQGLGLRKKYQKQFVMSNSIYNKIVRFTNRDGISLLQADLTQPTAERLLGKVVDVIDDDVAGADFAMYGDLEKLIVLFKKKEVQTKWEDHLRNGKYFKITSHHQAHILNSDAAIKLTFNLDGDVEVPVEPEV